MLKRTSEFNDKGFWGTCGPTALHEVADADWTADDVLEACTACAPGLWLGKGMRVDALQDAMDMLCLSYERHTQHRLSHIDLYDLMCGSPRGRAATRFPTLAQFARENPRGVHVVIVKDHALVVRDGKVVDPNWEGRSALRRRVRESFHVHNPGPAKYQPATRS